jgi:glycosyltransferase involved in cell wall biosynthesis
MRILHIYKDYFPILGGIENTIRVLAEAQSAAGHEVTVLVCNTGLRSQRSRLNGVRLLKAGRLTTMASMPLSLRQLLLLWGQHPDLIHVHTPYPLGEVGVWLLKRQIPYVISYQSDVVRQRRWLQIYGPLFRKVLRRAARIIASSPRYIETSPWLGPVKERCTVVPLGVDPIRFSPPPVPFAGPPTLLFVGRLRYYKGLDTLLNALPLVPGVRLQVAGSGPMLGMCQHLVETLGLRDRVAFLGDVTDAELPSLYPRAHLFVLPANARAEAFGMVLLEAMASGLPCITTEVGTGTSWVVQDGVTGRVVPPQEPVALAEAIQSVLEDAELRHRMGRAARQRVESEFTLDRMSDRVMAIYQGALSVQDQGV